MFYERGSSIDSGEVVPLSELGLAHPERRPYAPTGWGPLRLVFAELPAGPGEVFVDIGSGVGRVVAQAARRPYARVLGVELSPELTERARRYVDEQRRRLKAPVELVCADATAWHVPDDVTQVFLNNPFLGETLDAVVANIVASHDRRPRALRVVYLNPLQADRLLGTGRFEVVKHVRRKHTVSADEFLVLRVLPASS